MTETFSVPFRAPDWEAFKGAAAGFEAKCALASLSLHNEGVVHVQLLSGTEMIVSVQYRCQDKITALRALMLAPSN